MSALGNLVVSLALDTAAFTKGVDKSSYEAQKFAQDLDRTLNRSLGAAKQNFIGFGSAALGAIGVVTSVTEAISRLNETFAKLDSLAKDSQRFGIPVEQLSQLQYAADMSGVSIEGLGVALKGMLKNASEAASGEKGPAEVFRALGVAAVDANGKVRSSTELIEDFAEVFAGLDDGATKTSLALKVFGKSGAELIPLLNSGREGIRRLNDEASRSGAVVGTDAAKAAEVYQDNLSRLSVSFDSLFKSTAASLLPSLVSITSEMANATAAAGSLGGGVQVLINDFVSLGSPAQKIQDLNKELVEAKENLEIYGGFVGQFFAGKQVAAIESQIRYNKAILDAQIADAVKPPTILPDGSESASTKQKKENEQREKKEREDRIKQVLAEGEAAKRLAEQRQREVEQRRKQLDVERQYADLMKQIGQQNQSYESLVQYLDEHDNYLKAKEEETRALERELQEVGLSEQALVSLRAERLREIATLKEATAAKESDTFAAERLRKEAEELRKQADIKLQIFDAQSADKEIKKAAEESKRAFESITGDIASAITSGIADGSIKGQDFIKRLFKTTVVRVAIEPFVKGSVAAIMGAFGFGGTAAASGGVEGVASAASTAGGLGNLVSGVQSVYSAFTGGFTNILANFSAEVGKVAFDLSSSLGYSAQQAATFGNSAISATQSFGQIAGGLAVAYGGYQLGRAISGGYAVGGGTGNSAVNTGATIGAIVGSIVPGIGTAIGAALGSIAGGTFNRLFGRKTVLGASGIQGDFTGQGLSNAVGFQDVTQKGGLFRSDKSFTNLFGIDQKAIDAVNQAFLDVRQSVELASNALRADFATGLQNLNLTGRLGGDLQAVLSNATDALIGEIAKTSLGINDDFLDFLKGIKQESEKLVDVFVRVSRNVSTANRALLLLGQSAQFSIRNAEDALGLIGSLGDQGLQLLEQFTQSFVPVQDQFKRQVALFDQAVRELGLSTKVSINTTREEFARLVQSVDLTTAAGQRELALLLQIMPQLSTLIQKREQEKAAAEALSKSIEANVKSIRGDFAGLLDAIATRADSLSPAAFRTAIASIQSAVNSVTPKPVMDFASAISKAVPTDEAYRNFIGTVGQLQPTTGAYLKFVNAVQGFTPNTAAYKSFVDAVSGTKPTDAAYKAFVASVQGLKPSDSLYRAFVDAVGSAKPKTDAYSAFIAQVQAKSDSLKTMGLNQALDALKGQIDKLQNSVIVVNFSNFTTQISKVSADIKKLGAEISSTVDVGTRLQLEDQLQQAVVARYQIEQEMLGGVFASIQTLFDSIKGERIAVRESAIEVLGGQRVLSPTDIRAGIREAAKLGALPSTDAISAAAKRIADAEAGISKAQSTLAGQNQLLTLSKNRQAQELKTLDLVKNSSINNQINFASAAEDAAIRIARDFGLSLNGFGINDIAQVSGSGDQRAVNTRFDSIGYNVGNESGVQSFKDTFYRQNGNTTSIAGMSLFDAIFGANNRIQAALAEYSTKAKALSDFVQIYQTVVDRTKGSISAFEQEASLAEKAKLDAEQKFAEQIQKFVIDAGRAASQLGKLRDETVRYFQEQQRLASALMASSQGLRQTIADIRFADLNPQQQLDSLLASFSAKFNAAKQASGDALANAGTDLNSLINPILQKAQEVFASGAQFQGIKETLLSQADTIARRIESLTPTTYQQESLALLDTIDTTLALIENNTRSAEQLIVDAIGVSADRTVAVLSEIYKGITGAEIPAFAKGGMHSGGLRLVGERGPELEVTGPSRIIPNNQLMGMMRPQLNDSREVVAELRESNRLLSGQMRILQATAQRNSADNAEMREELRQIRRKAFSEAGQ